MTLVKTTIYMATSADGFIARSDGSTPWSDAEWKSYVRTVNRYGNLVIGRKTYEIMKKGKELEKIGSPLVVVVSKKRLKGAAVASSPREAIALLKKNKFGKALIGGGAILNSAFIKEGLVDEIILDVEPLAFGRGVRLFDKTLNPRVSLISAAPLGNGVKLRYKVMK